MLYDYSNNFEFIDIGSNDYKQIKSVISYYDFYAKRNISKDELGGYVHKNVIKHIHNWVEKDYTVGDIVIEEVQAGSIHQINVVHSPIKHLKPMVDEMQKYWQLANTVEKSAVNAILFQTRLINEFIDNIIVIENRCVSKKVISEVDLILLWTLLGVVQESILKVYITVFRNKYKDENDKKFIRIEDNIDNIHAGIIIEKLKKGKDISLDDKITLEIINNNRNMIHFISNRPVLSYDVYLEKTDKFIRIADGLFAKQIEFIGKDLSKDIIKVLKSQSIFV